MPADTVHLTETGSLAERLVARGLVGAVELERARELQARTGTRLTTALLRLGCLGEAQLLRVYGEMLGWPLLDSDAMPATAGEMLALIQDTAIPLDWWIDQSVIAWRDAAGQVWMTARDPVDPLVQETCLEAFGAALQPALARGQSIERCLELLRRHRRSESETSLFADPETLSDLADDAPTIEFVNSMLAQAAEEGASDIHIEPRGDDFVVRYRVDGVLNDRIVQPRERYEAVLSRIKLMSGIDIAERRLPQDGRQAVRFNGQAFDLRVSTLPGMGGESLVIRLLPKTGRSLSLEGLGFAGEDLRKFREAASAPDGIILVTGPTGSGKTTSLYAALSEINTGEKKIVTVEDPIEYDLPRVFQAQVNAEIEYTFARALRSILRQDPDVIMIGEIRDTETAQIAVQAALTGHTVFSTLHTTNALGAAIRLIDMGVEPYRVAASVRALTAQRLVRQLCPACRRPAEAPPVHGVEHLEERLAATPAAWSEAVGCVACHGTGYAGRIGLFEIALMTPDLQDVVARGARLDEMQRVATANGLRTLREDGYLKARRGETAWREVLRVTGAADVIEDVAEE